MNATMNQTPPEPGYPVPHAGRNQDLTGRVSDGQANAIYTVGYNLSQRGKYDQAATLFTMLTIYRPKDPKYTRAVAICFRKMGQYEEAIRLFARTMELRPDNYEPAFQLIECMLLMGKQDEANDLLEAIAAVACNTGQTQLLEQATGMLELLDAAADAADAAELAAMEVAA